MVQTFTFVATAYDNKGNTVDQIYVVKVNNTMNTPPAPVGLPYNFSIVEVPEIEINVTSYIK